MRFMRIYKLSRCKIRNMRQYKLIKNQPKSRVCKI